MSLQNFRTTIFRSLLKNSGGNSVRKANNKMKPAAIIKYRDVGDFVSKHLVLVEMERQAEIDEQKELVATMSPEQLEKAGICMRRMVLASQAVSLFGRTVCSFQPSSSKRAAMAAAGTSTFTSSSVLSPGDIAGLVQGQSASSASFSKTLMSGVVTKVSDGTIDIAFDSFEADKDGNELDPYEPMDIVRLAPDITYRRLKSGLENLATLRHPLLEVFFESRPPILPVAVVPETDEDNLPPSSGLNASQRNAIVNALAQPEVAVIHGPPGTGKTTTLAEFISRAVAKGTKVLACAPSNVAVDNLAEKLLDRGVKSLIRLGHPARVLPRLQSCCLDAVMAESDIMAVCDDIKQEINDNSAKLLRSNDRSEKWRLRGILRELRKELNSRHRRAVKEVIQGADVVLSTLTSLGNEDGVLARNSKQMQFGLVAIDECSQAIEAACWLALPFAPKCVLAGDHLQLPATIVSDRAASEGLAISLMERVVTFLPPEMVTLLSVQYRMHNDIMEWSNKYLYESKLSAHQSVATHTLADLLPSLRDDAKKEQSAPPVVFVDTAGCPECAEIPAPDDLSHGNPGEAIIVGKHVAFLVNECGLKASLVGVISPYNHQVELIREQLQLLLPLQSHLIEVRSVDGFQGREKEAIVLSLVRSNDERVIGFLGEVPRLNVAVTRARRHLFVVGDSDTLKHGEHLKHLVEYLYDRAEVRIGSEYFNTPMSSAATDAKLGKESVTVSASKKSKLKMEPPPAVVESIAPPPAPLEPSKVTSTNDKKASNENDDESDLDESVAQPKKSNRALRKERKQKQAEERQIAKIVSSSEAAPSVQQPQKTTSSDRSPSLDPNVLVVKPIARAPVQSAGISKGKGISAADSASKKALEAVADPNDIDALCEAVKQLDSKCAYHQAGQSDACQKSVNVLAEFCRYCKRKFCFAHAQPEIHGCGAEAKAFERQNLRSAFESRQLKETCLISERANKKSLDRSVLEKRMDERLSKMKDDRSTSNKNKKKK